MTCYFMQNFKLVWLIASIYKKSETFQFWKFTSFGITTVEIFFPLAKLSFRN